ncbi:MAG: FtsW/RodA/SpoVE family cell cycle protein [Lachnospiraceae bacterium]|nr:FtsW/RodA/SpoVE family cell cycle protein [Lachnospiraceae bacterium]
MEKTITASVSPAAAELAGEAIQPRRTDKQIWGIYIALCIISIIELYSASSHEVNASNVLGPVIRHVAFLLVGLMFMIYLQNQHYRKFLRWSYIFAGFSVVSMLYTLKFGENINGANRSFSVGGLFALQPAEMIKLSAALMVAAILSKSQLADKEDVSAKGFRKATVWVLICGALLFFQGLTNTLLVMGISFSMMIIGGVGWKKLGLVSCIFILAGILGIGAKVGMALMHTTEKVEKAEMVVPGTEVVLGGYENEGDQGLGRIMTWLNRFKRHSSDKAKWDEKITGINAQEQYSYMAQAHGGAFGVMPGNSRETARLPLASSDYIYAIVIEELGLMGGLMVLVLYMWLLARAARIANRCQTAYPALLVIGMAIFIAYQAIFHMCIVTGVFPVSGQPLPLISRGGTSVIITSIALGIMLSVSRFAARKGKRAEIKDELSALPDEVNAENPT